MQSPEDDRKQVEQVWRANGEEPQAWCTTTMAGIDHWTNTFFEGKNTEEVESFSKPS